MLALNMFHHLRDFSLNVFCLCGIHDTKLLLCTQIFILDLICVSYS